MTVKHFIPNFITLLNLFCGCIAVMFAVQSNFIATAIFVFLGVFFDFFDGLLARKLNVQSALGVQLDSLADMVTSGLVPGIVMVKLISSSLNTSEVVSETDWYSNMSIDITSLKLLPLIGFCITLASAYRLAKFNIDEDQQTYFKGLPTPANTLFVMSLPLIVELQNNAFINTLISNHWFLIGVTLLSCYMLNSNIKLFALKFRDFNFKTNMFRFILIILSIVLVLFFHFVAIPIIIILYVVLSLIKNLATEA